MLYVELDLVFEDEKINDGVAQRNWAANIARKAKSRVVKFRSKGVNGWPTAFFECPTKERAEQVVTLAYGKDHREELEAYLVTNLESAFS
jgi:hypothetical protein